MFRGGWQSVGIGMMINGTCLKLNYVWMVLSGKEGHICY